MKKLSFFAALAAMLMGFASCEKVEPTALETSDLKGTTLAGYVYYPKLDDTMTPEGNALFEGKANVTIGVAVVTGLGAEPTNNVMYVTVPVKGGKFEATIPAPAGKMVSCVAICMFQQENYDAEMKPDDADIKKAYHKLVMKYHPDKNPGDKSAEEKFKDDLVNTLVKKSTIPAPEILIDDQMRMMRDDVTRNAASRGQSFEEFLESNHQTIESWEKEARKIAEARVKASLALQTVAVEQKITVSDDLVNAKIAELKDVYKKSPEAIKSLKDPNVRIDIKNRMIIEATLDYLVKANS